MAPARGALLPRGAARRAVACPPHRRPPRRGADLGLLARRHGRRLQLLRRDHPPVLQRRPRAGDRRSGRDRRLVGVAAARLARLPARPGGGGRGDSRLDVRAARADAELAPDAPLCRSDRRLRVGRAHRRRAARLGHEQRRTPRRASRRARRTARRAGRLLGADGVDGPQRRTALRGSRPARSAGRVRAPRGGFRPGRVRRPFRRLRPSGRRRRPRGPSRRGHAERPARLAPSTTTPPPTAGSPPSTAPTAPRASSSRPASP